MNEQHLKSRELEYEELEELIAQNPDMNFQINQNEDGEYELEVITE